MHSVQSEAEETTEETIKTMINREYYLYFKRNRPLDIYKPDDAFFKRPSLNEINKRFDVQFGKAW